MNHPAMVRNHWLCAANDKRGRRHYEVGAA